MSNQNPKIKKILETLSEGSESVRNNPSEQNYRDWEEKIEKAGNGFNWGMIVVLGIIFLVFLFGFLSFTGKLATVKVYQQPTEYIEATVYSPAKQSNRVTISLTNEHCENVNFYVDGQFIKSIAPNATYNFTVSSGYHNTSACVGGTTDCGSTNQVDWTYSTSHRIIRGQQCDNGSQQDDTYDYSTCNETSISFSVTPNQPTLSPGATYTANLQFYNPTKCDFNNVSYKFGWAAGISGPSQFTVGNVPAGGYTNVPISLTVSSEEGTGYSITYNLVSNLCTDICPAITINADVQGKKKKK